MQTDIAMTIDDWRRVIATQIREHGQMDMSGDHPRLVILKKILDIMNEAGREKEVLTLIREFENGCYEGTLTNAVRTIATKHPSAFEGIPSNWDAIISRRFVFWASARNFRDGWFAYQSHWVDIQLSLSA